MRSTVAMGVPSLSESERCSDRASSRRAVRRVVANPQDIHRYTAEFFALAKSVRAAQKAGGNSGAASFEQLVELGKTNKQLDANDQGVIRVVDWLWQYAFDQRASDIHLEPRREQGVIRFRIDGVLHPVYQMPLGVMAAMVWFAYSRQRPFLQVMDFVAPCVPTGLAAGRVGNFINGELWGRVADPALPWGMVFRGAGDLPRHPSQIYQFLMEGLLLFVLLWLYARKPRQQGQVAAAFLFGYGMFRFVAEFFREPDAHLGLLSLGMSMGQWLCLPMIAGGAWLWLWCGRRLT